MLRKFCETFAKVAVFMCERKKRKLRLHETKVCPPPTRTNIHALVRTQTLKALLDAGAKPDEEKNAVSVVLVRVRFGIRLEVRYGCASGWV